MRRITWQNGTFYVALIVSIAAAVKERERV